MMRERKRGEKSEKKQTEFKRDESNWRRSRKINAENNKKRGQKSELFTSSKKKVPEIKIDATCLAKANYHFMRVLELLSAEENSILTAILTPDREEFIEEIRQELIQKIEEGS
jgi:Mg-chelatase subunit ChlD